MAVTSPKFALTQPTGAPRPPLLLGPALPVSDARRFPGGLASEESGSSRRGDPAPPFEVWIDFDGTLVETNVAMEVVAEFGLGGRRAAESVDRRLSEHRMTLREAWAAEVSGLSADRLEEMASFAVRRTRLRRGAVGLCTALRDAGIPAIVLSGGLDFYIDPVLRNAGLDLPVRSDVVLRAGRRLILAHPYGHPTCRRCGICKAQEICRPRGAPIPSVFIGDGATDRYAAEVADVVFARDRLLEYCNGMGIPYIPFEEFDSVTERLIGWAEEPASIPYRREKGRTASECPVSRDAAARVGWSVHGMRPGTSER